MKTEHTPRPWCTSVGKSGLTFVKEDKKYICFMERDLMSKEELYANARLIAAAPDLLEFLEELLDAHKNHAFLIDFQERAEKIIAKAKGL
jgi:hypothetical protein